MRWPRSLLQLGAGGLEVAVGDGELGGAAGVLADQAGGLDGDGHLVGERGERGELGREARRGAQAGLQVEGADHRAGPGADGDAGHRLEHELVDREVAGHAGVVAGAGGDDGLAGGEDLLGDGLGEAGVRVVAGLVARGVDGEIARALGRRGGRRGGNGSGSGVGGGDGEGVAALEDDEATLGAQERDGGVGGLLQEAIEIELAGDGAVDLEEAGQTVLADACGGGSGVSPDVKRHAVGGGGGDEIAHGGGADLLPAGVVPEHLAEIAGEALGDLLQQGQRGLAVASGPDGLPGGEPRAGRGPRGRATPSPSGRRRRRP